MAASSRRRGSAGVDPGPSVNSPAPAAAAARAALKRDKPSTPRAPDLRSRSRLRTVSPQLPSTSLDLAATRGATSRASSAVMATVVASPTPPLRAASAKRVSTGKRKSAAPSAASTHAALGSVSAALAAPVPASSTAPAPFAPLARPSLGPSSTAAALDTGKGGQRVRLGAGPLPVSERAAGNGGLVTAAQKAAAIQSAREAIELAASLVVEPTPPSAADARAPQPTAAPRRRKPSTRITDTSSDGESDDDVELTGVGVSASASVPTQPLRGAAEYHRPAIELDLISNRTRGMRHLGNLCPATGETQGAYHARLCAEIRGFSYLDSDQQMAAARLFAITEHALDQRQLQKLGDQVAHIRACALDFHVAHLASTQDSARSLELISATNQFNSAFGSGPLRAIAAATTRAPTAHADDSPSIDVRVAAHEHVQRLARAEAERRALAATTSTRPAHLTGAAGERQLQKSAASLVYAGSPPVIHTTASEAREAVIMQASGQHRGRGRTQHAAGLARAPTAATLAARAGYMINDEIARRQQDIDPTSTGPRDTSRYDDGGSDDDDAAIAGGESLSGDDDLGSAADDSELMDDDDREWIKNLDRHGREVDSASEPEDKVEDDGDSEDQSTLPLASDRGAFDTLPPRTILASRKPSASKERLTASSSVQRQPDKHATPRPSAASTHQPSSSGNGRSGHAGPTSHPRPASIQAEHLRRLARREGSLSLKKIQELEKRRAQYARARDAVAPERSTPLTARDRDTSLPRRAVRATVAALTEEPERIVPVRRPAYPMVKFQQKGSVSPHEWLTSLHHFFKINKVPDTDWATQLVHNLSDLNAQNEFDALQNKVVARETPYGCYMRVARAFLRRYEPSPSELGLLRQKIQRDMVRGVSESLEDYLQRFNKAVSSAYSSSDRHLEANYHALINSLDDDLTRHAGSMWVYLEKGLALPDNSQGNGKTYIRSWEDLQEHVREYYGSRSDATATMSNLARLRKEAARDAQLSASGAISSRVDAIYCGINDLSLAEQSTALHGEIDPLRTPHSSHATRQALGVVATPRASITSSQAQARRQAMIVPDLFSKPRVVRAATATPRARATPSGHAAPAAAAAASSRTTKAAGHYPVICPDCAYTHEWSDCPRNQQGARYTRGAERFTGLSPRATPDHELACIEKYGHMGMPRTIGASANRVTTHPQSDLPMKDEEEPSPNADALDDEAHDAYDQALILAHARRIDVSAHGQPEIIVRGSLNGREPHNLIVDTGSHVSLMSANYFSKHRADLGPLDARPKYRVTVATAQRAKLLGTTTVSLTLYDEREGLQYTQRAEFIVVENLSSPLLLGLNLIVDFYDGCSFLDGHLTFRRELKPDFGKVRRVRGETRDVQAMRDYTVLPYSRQLIVVQYPSALAPDPSSPVLISMVQPGTSDPHGTGLQFYPIIVNGERHAYPGRFELPVVNRTALSVAVRRGAVLGQAQVLPSLSSPILSTTLKARSYNARRVLRAQLELQGEASDGPVGAATSGGTPGGLVPLTSPRSFRVGSLTMTVHPLSVSGVPPLWGTRSTSPARADHRSAALGLKAGPPPPADVHVFRVEVVDTPSAAGLQLRTGVAPTTQPTGEVAGTFPPRPGETASSGPLPADTDVPVKFDINPDLSLAHIALMHALLLSKLDAFATHPTLAPTPAVGVEHVITLTSEQPVKQAQYRQSPLKQQAVLDNVRKLLERGLIEESNSAWSSPVVLVPKHDGSMRMCIDFRRLNACTAKDAYPIPLIDDCLHQCRKARWFTLLDIQDAFHHVRMAEGSKPLTAFVTPRGLYQWTRMPFGLCNAPATFQRYVDDSLRGLLGNTCAAFFDDCLVYSGDDFEQHMRDVGAVLDRLRSRGLDVNIKKCRFGYEQMLFVGHVVKGGTIMPDPEKVRAISHYPAPVDLVQLRSFLGLVTYYHRFIPGFALMANPLYKLLKKGVVWEWAGVHGAAFEQLRRALLAPACLHAPDFSRPFSLQTDASKVGIAAVLTQSVDGVEHPVGYISRQLSPAEQNYSATEWECLAVVWAVGQFEVYLVDAPFTIVTDHSALRWLPTKRFENSRIMRWAMKLSEFSYTVEHRAGTANNNADALSRNPIPGSAPTDDPPLTDPLLAPGEVAPHFIRAMHAEVIPFPMLCTRVTSAGSTTRPVAPRAQSHQDDADMHDAPSTTCVRAPAEVPPHLIRAARGEGGSGLASCAHICSRDAGGTATGAAPLSDPDETSMVDALLALAARSASTSSTTPMDDGDGPTYAPRATAPAWGTTDASCRAILAQQYSTSSYRAWRAARLVDDLDLAHQPRPIIATAAPVHAQPLATASAAAAADDSVAAPPLDKRCGGPPASSLAELDESDADNDISIIDLAQLQEVVDAQYADPQCRAFIEYCKRQAVPSSWPAAAQAALISQARNYILIDQPAPTRPALYYYPSQPKRGLSSLVVIVPRLVIPTVHRAALIFMFHDSPFGGHFGVKRTIRKVSVRYYWPSLAADVASHVGSCAACQQHKIQRRRHNPPLGKMAPATRPFELISFDFVGPMKHKSEDFRYLLVIVDHFTRWAIVVPTVNMLAETVAVALLDECFNRFGVPTRMLSDRGPSFRCKLMVELQRAMHVKHLFSSAYHPQANGMVERLNATLKDSLFALATEFGTQWVQTIQSAVMAYNTSVSESTGITPYYALFGRECVTPGDALAISADAADADTFDDAPPLELYTQVLHNNIARAHEHITRILRLNLTAATLQQLGQARVPVYHVGDYVWLRDPRSDSELGGRKGRIKQFKGPYIVRARVNDVAYTLRPVKGKGAETTVSIRRMKPCRSRDPTAPAPVVLSPDDDYAPRLAPLRVPTGQRGIAIPSLKERSGLGEVVAASDHSLDIHLPAGLDRETTTPEPNLHASDGEPAMQLDVALDPSRLRARVNPHSPLNRPSAPRADASPPLLVAVSHHSVDADRPSAASASTSNPPTLRRAASGGLAVTFQVPLVAQKPLSAAALARQALGTRAPSVRARSLPTPLYDDEALSRFPTYAGMQRYSLPRRTTG